LRNPRQPPFTKDFSINNQAVTNYFHLFSKYIFLLKKLYIHLQHINNLKTKNMNQVLLEFNEEQQQFHYNYVVDGIPQSKENENGWKTLNVCANVQYASLFADFLQVQYVEKRKASFIELEQTVDNLNRFLSIIYKMHNIN
jgi:hypothetical protein